MKNTFTRTLVAGMTLLVAAVAFADPAPPALGNQFLERSDERGRWRVALPDPATESSGVTFDLPAETVALPATVKVAVANGTRIYVEETIVLPSDAGAAPTIEFLAGHPRQLARIRKAAASRPDAIRFQVWAGGDQILDVPFVAADRGSDRLANGGTIAGSSESVIVRLREPRKLPMFGPCEDACEDAFFECYLNCDERGPGCPWCGEQYDECLFYCQ